MGTLCWWHSQHRVAKGEQWLRDRQSTACSHPQGIEAGGTPQSGWATLCQISMKSREPVLRHQRAPQRPAGATGGGELFLAPARMLGSRRDRAASRLERRRGAIFSSERVFANEACEQQRCWGAPTVPGTHSPTERHPLSPESSAGPRGSWGALLAPGEHLVTQLFLLFPHRRRRLSLGGPFARSPCPVWSFAKCAQQPLSSPVHTDGVFPTKEPWVVGFPSTSHPAPCTSCPPPGLRGCESPGTTKVPSMPRGNRGHRGTPTATPTPLPCVDPAADPKKGLGACGGQLPHAFSLDLPKGGDGVYLEGMGFIWPRCQADARRNYR